MIEDVFLGPFVSVGHLGHRNARDGRLGRLDPGGRGREPCGQHKGPNLGGCDAGDPEPEDRQRQRARLIVGKGNFNLVRRRPQGAHRGAERPAAGVTAKNGRAQVRLNRERRSVHGMRHLGRQDRCSRAVGGKRGVFRRRAVVHGEGVVGRGRRLGRSRDRSPGRRPRASRSAVWRPASEPAGEPLGSEGHRGADHDEHDRDHGGIDTRRWS